MQSYFTLQFKLPLISSLSAKHRSHNIYHSLMQTSTKMTPVVFASNLLDNGLYI